MRSTPTSPSTHRSPRSGWWTSPVRLSYSDRLRAAAADGVAVLLISSELEEILDLSSRIVVMHSGRIVGGMDRSDVDLEELGLLMGGAAP